VAAQQWEVAMRKILMVAAALALTCAASSADAQKFDKNGKCHAADGKFAKAEVCKGGAPAAAPAGPAHTYKLDAKGGCHDEKGKMAKKAMCSGK
jgi:hypothetical protein